jgi:hypothetical protein
MAQNIMASKLREFGETPPEQSPLVTVRMSEQEWREIIGCLWMGSRERELAVKLEKLMEFADVEPRTF